MACYEPLKAFRVGYKENGKEDIRISGFRTDHLEWNGDTWIASPSKIISGDGRRVAYKYYEIPCGKCVGCRAAYAKQWAERCVLELQQHDHAFFVTLTYDNNHLPMIDSVDQTTGEIRKLPTLVKKDFQQFMKNLRENYTREKNRENDDDERYKLRFYACGEYGASLRPHFHAIIFGLDLNDLVLYSVADGNELYNSELISKSWDHKGHCVVGSVTFESCAYVAGYVNKKLYGADADFFRNLQLEPEFTIMSRRPGIGAGYYEKVANGSFDFDTFDHFVVSDSSNDHGIHRVSIPRYFLNKIRTDQPDLYERLKQRRLDKQKAVTSLKLSQTSKDYLGMLESEKIAKISASDQVKRRCKI